MLSRKDARAIYKKDKQDLTGKTIKVWGKTGTVQEVYEHYTAGSALLVAFDNGTEGIVHPTIDVIEIVNQPKDQTS